MSNRMQNARNMEEKVAELLDGEQSEGPSSRAGVPDVRTDRFTVECKHRKELPQWLHHAINQADHNREELDGTVPIAVLHEKNRQHKQDYVVMPMWVFKFITNGGEQD